MPVKVCVGALIAMALAILVPANWSSASNVELPQSARETRLREQITLIYSYFSTGNFKAYVSMLSARERRDFRESREEWQKTRRDWTLLLSRMQPTAKLLEVQIFGRRARAKMRVSSLEPDGSRSSGVFYDYWVLESGDWFLDDAGRTE